MDGRKNPSSEEQWFRCRPSGKSDNDGKEEGHREPEWGMRLLDEADEDIERSLSLAGDVEEIKADSLNSVELQKKSLQSPSAHVKHGTWAKRG